ncbi:MAG: alpha/beta fold hydrolase [Pseudomonadota bacterium]
MNSSKFSRAGEDPDHWLWQEYYQAFPVFSTETVRAGCHPRKMIHSAGAEQAIVLVHGLSDSPYFMSAIGEYFHNALGYNVYIPLLQCHGLKSPRGMTGVALAEWLKNVRFAVGSATQGAARLSFGGLSMGGALGYFLSCIDPVITGDLYLFSAALGLAAGPGLFPGWFKEWLLRLPLVKTLGSTSSLVGNNPYRYNRVSLNSAGELAHLIHKINQLPFQLTDTSNPTRRIFAAWSECDKVINVSKLRELQRRIPADRFVPFIIPAIDHVEHACVVLKDSIHATGTEVGETPPLESANPRFTEMLVAISRFATGG